MAWHASRVISCQLCLASLQAVFYAAVFDTQPNVRRQYARGGQYRSASAPQKTLGALKVERNTCPTVRPGGLVLSPEAVEIVLAICASALPDRSAAANCANGVYHSYWLLAGRHASVVTMDRLRRMQNQG